MASLSPDGETVIVRIVYAGPSCAGKTTTLYALAKELLGQHAEQAVFTPATEDEHTLYFDWLDYTGGSVRGHRVRSQVLTVPGLDHLASRRQFLLQDADAVVFVIDAHPEQMAIARQAFQEMQPWLQRPATEPAVGVMVQANKHDLPDALSPEEIKQHLGSLPTLRVVSTTATAGTGIRGAFVKGVGLALERVLVLLQEERLPTAPPDIQSSEALLQAIKAVENPVREEPEEIMIPSESCFLEDDSDHNGNDNSQDTPQTTPMLAPPEQSIVEVQKPWLDAVLLEDMLATKEPSSSTPGVPEIPEIIDLASAEHSEGHSDTLSLVWAPTAGLSYPTNSSLPSSAPPPSPSMGAVAARLDPEDREEDNPKTSPLRQRLSTTIRSALSRIEEFTGVKRRER